MKRIVGYQWIRAALLAALPLTLIPGMAYSDPPPDTISYHIFLYNGGAYVDSCATSSYQTGHVFDLASGAIIGNVPGPGLDIYDANGVRIGYLTAYISP
jgi:hypothetical protein